MISTREAPTDEVVFRMDHCLDSAVDPQLEAFFRDLLQRASTRVVLDLSALDRINPQTVRMILLLWELLGRHGKVLRVRGLREDVRALFERLKIDRYIRCLP